MKKILIILIFLSAISKIHSQDRVTSLKTENTYHQKLLKGEKHKYKIKLKEGEFCSLTVMQMGVDAVVDLFDPSSKKIGSVDSPNGNNGPEDIEFTSDTDGWFHLEIYPLDDYSGMTESEKNMYIQQNQGDYEIGSISVLSKKENQKKLSEEKSRKQKITDALNFGFENKTTNENLPDNWLEYGIGYNIKIDSVEKHSGKRSILIEQTGDKKENPFGQIYLIPIPSYYKGNQIELRAYIKTRNVSERTIGLMLRLVGISGTLEIDNTSRQNIQGTEDWTLYSISLPFPENTKSIEISSIHNSDGQLWVDDFQLLIDGIDISDAKFMKPKEFKGEKDNEFDHGSKISSVDLTELNIENLTILGKVWGFLKYYHPAIAKGEYNWDYELFRIVPKILAAGNKEERNLTLSEWIVSLRKTDTAKFQTKPIREIKLNPDLDWIDNSELGEKLASQLINIKKADRTGGSYYIGTISTRNPDFKNERVYEQMKFPDAGFRLLCLYRYWNIIQYYFPYKYLTDDNWNDILKEYIAKFINASDALQYKLTVLSLIARIHDTHANIDGDEVLENSRGKNYAPVKITFIENKAVVTDYFDKELGEKSGLKTGDVIESVNDKSVDKIIEDLLPYTPASNYPTQLAEIAMKNLMRTNDKYLNVEYKRSNNVLNSQIECYSTEEMDIYKFFLKQDTCFKMINSEISYIYPGSIKNKYLPEIMKEVFKTKGLIIDLRCYPSEFIVYTLSEYLHPNPVSFAKFSNCSITSPGLFVMSQSSEVGKKIDNYFKGKVVIMVNEETISQAEFTTMAFRTAPGAVVIGSQTEGADGDFSRVTLPGGIYTGISGNGVYYPDGKQTQRIGIIPDIEVKPTIKGIVEGRDEVLEKAIEIINEN